MRTLLLRLTSAALVALVAAVSLPAATSAGDPAVVSIDPASISVQENQTFEIAVFLDPAHATTSAWVVNIGYDPALLQYVDCRALDHSEPGALQASQCNDTGANLKTLGASLRAHDNLGLDKVTQIGAFRLTAVAPAGSSGTLAVSTQTMADPDGFDEPVETHDATLSITPAIPGDADCNGTIGLGDMLGALRSAAGLDAPVRCWPNADLNHDSRTDARDALIILDTVAGLA